MRVRALRTLAAAVLAAVVGSVPAGVAAQAPDTARAFPLDELVVTADRAASPLASSIAAVTRVSGAELAQLPLVNAAGVLRRVPGFALVDFDGLGHDPAPIVRGFYGGGEAEYVLLLVDSRPLNDVQAGLIAWDLIPPVAIEAVEVVRGGSSALYGDAALGGVVNLVTKGDSRGGSAWSLTAGEHGLWRGGARWNSGAGEVRVSAWAGVMRTAGFREHASRSVGAAGADVEFAASGERVFTLSAHGMWRDLEEPGPLSEDDLAAGRSKSSVFYRHDQTREWVGRASLRAAGIEAAGGNLSADVGLDVRRTDATRTLPLAPTFADTKDREVGAERMSGNVQWDRFGLGAPWRDRLIVGLDLSLGQIDSRHYQRVTGDPSAYVSHSTRGALDARGHGSRRAAALFVQYEVLPTEALRLSFGARGDWLRDEFEPSGQPTTDVNHRAFSPKAGLNLRWIERPGHAGNVYVSVGRSFKAPTLDQLFDQRTVPVPFPPFSITSSNTDLEPQTARSVEVGAYHAFAPAGAAWSGSLSLALYDMDVENEIDFDVATLSYGNIGESRHRGVEAGLTLDAPSGVSLFANYALQEATARAGDHAGNQLKAIPRHTLNAGATARFQAVEGGVHVTRQSGAWIDDPNTIPLDAFTTVDARVSYEFAGVSTFLELTNVFDRAFSSTGFPDPSGSGTVYYHPAAGRTLRVGATLER